MLCASASEELSAMGAALPISPKPTYRVRKVGGELREDLVPLRAGRPRAIVAGLVIGNQYVAQSPVHRRRNVGALPRRSCRNRASPTAALDSKA